MRIKPNESYKLLGTTLQLDKGRVYDAVKATNQPNYEEEGLIFVSEILLNKNEYQVVD
tara:strand:- start:287 stop:460 length:174 start_codon:yes stop_codon:yes gene_type:complete